MACPKFPRGIPLSSVIPLDHARALLQVSNMLRGYVARTGDSRHAQLFLKTAGALENRARNPLPDTLGQTVDLSC